MTTATNAESQWRPNVSPWIIAISVMLATFMEVLDTSVANVALPHMAGSYSASTDEATWVLTSYLVANAIMLPATAWFGNLFGRKKFFIICIIIFTLASLLCGLAPSLEVLIFARILQGLGGGALQPVSQAILFESFPREKRGIATAVFGLGVVTAPIIGPTLGGWITDNFSWNWIFLINIPVGIGAIILSYLFVEDPPYIKNAVVNNLDFIGFGLMAVWLATLQIVLDKGQQADWFSTPWICWFSAISIICFVAFVLRQLIVKDPIVNLKIIKDRNFAVGLILITAVGAVLYGTLAMLPLFLQNLLQYTALNSGLAISPRGIGSFLTIMIVGSLINKVDNRFLVVLGFILLGISCYLLGNMNFEIGVNNIIFPNVISGIALSLLFIPLTTLSFGTLNNIEIANATGIFNLMRNLGGSIGISLVTTFLSRSSQVHQNYMVSHLTPYNPLYNETIQQATSFLSRHADTVTASKQATGIVYGTLVRQASLWSFLDNFRLFAFICFALIPFIFVFKKVKQGKSDISVH